MKNDLYANFFSTSRKTNNATHLKRNAHDKVRRPMSYPDNDLPTRVQLKSHTFIILK